MIRMKNLENTYACNFTVMNKSIICNTVPSIKNEKWIEKLRIKNIHLSDVSDESNTAIDVLIGADVAGKLLKKRDFSNFECEYLKN